MKNNYYAIEVTTVDGKKCLCWLDNKNLYFAIYKKGFAKPNTPILFNSRKEAAECLANVPNGKGNLKQFHTVVEAKKNRIVKVQLEIIK